MFNKKIRALLFADIFWFFGEGMLGPIFAIFAQKVGGDILDITWAWATYLIITGLLMILIGKLSDKINKRKIVFIGYLLNAIFTFCYLFIHTPTQLLFLQGGLGIAAALATPTWNSLYSEYGNKKKRGLSWGLADGSSQLFTGLAIILGGLIVTNYSFNLLFIIMTIIQIISVILLVPIIKE